MDVEERTVARGVGVRDKTIRLTVNGTGHERTVPVRRSLSDFLRDDLGLTGTHVGCEHGVCGACTILMDGHPVRSCLLFAVQADGSELTTIEGLAEYKEPNPLTPFPAKEGGTGSSYTGTTVAAEGKPSAPGATHPPLPSQGR